MRICSDVKMALVAFVMTLGAAVVFGDSEETRSTYTASEQYVQSLVASESNRTDIAIQRLRTEVETAGFITTNSIVAGENISISYDEDGKISISADAEQIDFENYQGNVNITGSFSVTPTNGLDGIKFAGTNLTTLLERTTEPLNAGTGIEITNNTISAKVDTIIAEHGENPVSGGAIYLALQSYDTALTGFVPKRGDSTITGTITATNFHAQANPSNYVGFSVSQITRYKDGLESVYMFPATNGTIAGETNFLAVISQIAPDYNINTNYRVGQLIAEGAELKICTNGGLGPAAEFADATVEDALVRKADRSEIPQTISNIVTKTYIEDLGISGGGASFDIDPRDYIKKDSLDSLIDSLDTDRMTNAYETVAVFKDFKKQLRILGGQQSIYLGLSNIQANSDITLQGFSVSAGTPLKIDWGDGNSEYAEVRSSGEMKYKYHTYETQGDYTIKVTGDITQFKVPFFFGPPTEIVYTNNFTSVVCDDTIAIDYWDLDEYRPPIRPRKLKVLDMPTLTGLPDDSVSSFESLETVRLASIVNIGNYGFARLKELREVYLPSAKTLGVGAFMSCTNMQTIEAHNITTLWQAVFSNCVSLISFDFSNLSNFVNDACFMGCSSLQYVDLSNRNGYPLTLYSRAFANCTSLHSVASDTDGSIYGSFPQYDSAVFSNCTALTRVTLPRYDVIYGSAAFAGCIQLESITLEDIGSYGNHENMFFGIGESVPIKSDGTNSYKCLVTMTGQTCSSLQGVTDFPWGAPITTKFQCTDGYIIYNSDEGNWESVRR